MPSSPPFAARPLDPVDYPAAVSIAVGAGVQGIYVSNVLSIALSDPGGGGGGVGGGGQFLGLYGADGLLGLVYFGPRGNLLVLESTELDPAQVARVTLDALWPWRIALAPVSVVGHLLQLGGLRALVNRQQIYYGVTGEELQPAPAATALRRADRKDLKRLMAASLSLNQSDLHVDPWRVDRDWLRRNTRARIREGSTYVLGPVGRPFAKLDVGSRGTAGLVIEGVYTWPEVRGQGHAAALVAAVAAEALASYPVVCLHVAKDNVPARRAYEKCGMRQRMVCQLLLRD